MVDVNDPQSEATEGVPAPPPRRRRAASRPAGPPAHIEPAAVDAVAVEDADDEAAADEVAPAEGADGEHAGDEGAADEESADNAATEEDAAEEDATAGVAPVEGGASEDARDEAVVDVADGAGPQDPAAEAVDGGEPSGSSPDAQGTAEEAAPVLAAEPPRSRHRRATRGRTTVAFSAEPVDAQPAPIAAPAEAAPLALFQPPDEAALTPRRRRSRAAARPATTADTDADTDTATPEPDADVPTGPTEPAEPSPEDTTPDPEPTDDDGSPRRRRRRGGRRRRRSGGAVDTDGVEQEDADEQDAVAEAGDEDQAGAEALSDAEDAEQAEAGEDTPGSRRRRRRRRRAGVAEEMEDLSTEDPANTVVKVREARRATDEITSVRGSTRIEAKKQRRRDGREAGRRRPPILTEAEFLARRESVNRVMCVREHGDRTQIAVLEDGVLVEHYVNRVESSSMVGNVYLGKVQNVLPSMEAAFVDIGRGRNAVLYAGEVNWDAAGLEGQPKRIELALKSGDPVLVQVTKDPIGHKGARLTSQISLPGRFLVYVPEGSMTGISRKLPDTERARLKGILKEVVPDGAGVIVRTAAEGATEAQLTADVTRLTKQWTDITKKAKTASAPALLYGEPDLAIKVVRDIFNEDFTTLMVQGEAIWQVLHDYIEWVAPDLIGRLEQWVEPTELYSAHRIDEQLAKALDRKVWLPSGGSLVIDRTEAMTVVDVNTGKFTGQGGNLEETVTRNNLEAAEEIVRQLRLRDIGGIIVIDFIDMVLESNRDLVLRRLVECLGRDRTKHQVAEVTSLGLVQMTRKRIGQGLLEVFSTPCEACSGRGVLVTAEPVGAIEEPADEPRNRRSGTDRDRGRKPRPAAPVHLGGKQTGKTPPPPRFDEHGHIDHSTEDAHDHPAHQGEPGDAEPVHGEPVHAEPVHGEPVAAEPGAVEPVALEPVAVEPVEVEPVDAEQDQAQPADAELSDAGLSDAGLSDAGLSDAEPARAESDDHGQDPETFDPIDPEGPDVPTEPGGLAEWDHAEPADQADDRGAEHEAV